MSYRGRRGGWFGRRGYGFRRFEDTSDSEGILEFVSDPDNFIKALIGADDTEIEEYTADIMSNG